MEEKKGSSSGMVVHMRGGTGPGSFHDFSKSLQSNLNDFFWPKLSYAIANACKRQQAQQQPLADDDDDDDEAPACFAIADFGCSCAWSTVNTMHFMAKCVVDCMQASRSPAKQQQQQLHIQAFFNDLPFNDFNTLFAHLSSCQPTTQAGRLHFMPCALPGSFYTRLFPPRYLQIGLCTLALHNLSQVPDAVQDPNSPAWNENGTWILDGCKTETATAYKKQFQADFTCFLRHRSQELVAGGLLFCVMIAANVDDTSSLPSLDHDHLCTNLQAAWRQLVSEGLLEQGTLDTFNLPIFTPTVDEVKEVVCSEAVAAEMEVVEVEYVEVERAERRLWMESAAADGQTWGRTCETMARNFWGSHIQAHFNDPTKFEMLMERLRHAATADDEVYRSSIIRLVVLALSRR